ncbi:MULTISPECIES: hypothetical protein [unclassified Nonomuraea]
MTVLQVREIHTGRLLGTIDLTGDGELTASAAELHDMFVQTMASRGLSAAEVFEWYTGWSNGYVEIVPVG